MTRGLIIILHGSPREESNAPALRIAEKLRQQGFFHIVMVAYMECNQPTIPQAISDCAEKGCSHITALPWFLHAGRHLVLDVPTLLLKAAENQRGLTIEITDPIGTSSRIAEALAQRADEARPQIRQGD